MKCDVIVTYCWNRVGYNILRSLSDKGISVIVGDTSKKNICSMSKFVTGSFTYPDPFTQEEEFIDCLVDKIKTYNPIILLPTHDESIIIAKHRHKFPCNLIIPIADYELLKLLEDKLQSTKIAQKANIPTPQLIDNIAECTYPVIIKGKIGNSAKNVYKVNNDTEAINVFSKFGINDFFVEEYVPGCDISVDCIRYPDFFYATIYKAIITKTNDGGTTTQRIIIENQELIEYAKKFLDYINYNGVCGLDFRYDKESDRYAFLEINARYTGGIATPIAAGFDIPYIHYCIATQSIYNKNIQIKYGTKTKWILGDIITLITSLFSGTLSWDKVKKIFDFKSFDAFDDYSSDDKRAILGEMLYYALKLLKHKKLNP